MGHRTRLDFMALSLLNSTANRSGLLPDATARSSEVVWDRSRCSTVDGDLQRRAGELHRLELDYHPVDLANILFQPWSPLSRKVKHKKIKKKNKWQREKS